MSETEAGRNGGCDIKGSIILRFCMWSTCWTISIIGIVCHTVSHTDTGIEPVRYLISYRYSICCLVPYQTGYWHYNKIVPVWGPLLRRRTSIIGQCLIGLKTDWMPVFSYLYPCFSMDMDMDIKWIQKLESIIALNKYGYKLNIKHIQTCSKQLQL